MQLLGALLLINECLLQYRALNARMQEYINHNTLINS